MTKEKNIFESYDTLDKELARVISLGPHCTHKDYNHPNAWGRPYHIGHPNKNVVMKMINRIEEASCA
jgi:hypothetical protein